MISLSSQSSHRIPRFSYIIPNNTMTIKKLNSTFQYPTIFPTTDIEGMYQQFVVSLQSLARTSQENSIRNSFKICRCQGAYNLFFNKVGCIFSRIFGYFSVFFFFSWKSSHCFRCLFIRSQITVKKKKTPREKKKRLFHSFNRFYSKRCRK